MRALLIWLLAIPMLLPASVRADDTQLTICQYWTTLPDGSLSCVPWTRSGDSIWIKPVDLPVTTLALPTPTPPIKWIYGGYDMDKPAMRDARTCHDALLARGPRRHRRAERARPADQAHAGAGSGGLRVN